jgi:hypothetical protein
MGQVGAPSVERHELSGASLPATPVPGGGTIAEGDQIIGRERGESERVRGADASERERGVSLH